MNIKAISLQTYGNCYRKSNLDRKWAQNMPFNFTEPSFFFNCVNENTEFKLAYNNWLGQYNL